MSWALRQDGRVGYIRYISYAELCELLNKSFYLARTTKVPYLSEEESKLVVKRLLEKYEINKR